MKQEHRSLLAIALSVGVFVLWYWLLAPKPPSEPPQPATTPDAVEPALPEKQATVVDTSPAGPKETFKLASPLMEVTLSNQGALLDSVVIRGYYRSTDKDAGPIDLVSGDDNRALFLVCRHCNFELPALEAFQQVAADEQSASYRLDSEDLVITRHYQLDPARYLINQRWVIENKSDRPIEGQIGLGWSVANPPPERGFLSGLKGSVHRQSLVYGLAGSVERIQPEKNAREGIERGVIAWAGLESRYFLAALISRQLSEQEFLTYRLADERLETALFYPKVVIPPGDRAEGVVSIYVGPKEIDRLKAIGVGLEEAIDYGWFAFLALPILYLLKFFEGFLGSWGLAIILLTLVAKLLLNPLSIKSLKSMKAMQKLQPRLKELREKYHDDKQRLNQETMHLFRTHKVNPMGGCLPMLVQMPIYIALYKVLFSSIELYHAPFLLYKDLSAPDPYYVTPVLLGIFMFFQQKMTPQASADPTQAKMMMVMPVMFTVFMLFLPLGLIVYILVNTIMTVVQHWMFNKDIRWRDLLRGRIRVT